uniref:Uncharacterized protein n=1 Tax=Globodera pallida TaxID=36090 RepID=A0A183C884_GLOPA
MLVYYQWFKTIVDEISLDEHKQLITNYLEAIEIWIETLEDSKSLSPLVEQDIEYFKFLEQGKQSLEGYLQRDDANANLNDKKSAKIPIDGTLEAMHGGTVGRLLSLKSFRDKLKRIEINKKRMNELFDDGAEIVLNLLNLSQKSKKIEPKGKSQKVEPKGKGQIATKSDEPPPPLNSSTDDSEIFAMKIKKSCYMQSFLEWVTNNGTMHSESAPWRKFLDKFVLSKIVKSKIGAPSRHFTDDTKFNNELQYSKFV